MSNQQTLEQQLESLIGKTIKYENKEHVIQSHKKAPNQLTILVFTDRRTFNLDKEQLQDFLTELTVVDKSKEVFIPDASKIETKTSESKKINLQIYEPTDVQKEVQNSLVDMLKLVKDDPKNIPQAKAVCEIANTMVNMEKAQIELMKLARRSS